MLEKLKELLKSKDQKLREELEFEIKKFEKTLNLAKDGEGFLKIEVDAYNQEMYNAPFELPVVIYKPMSRYFFQFEDIAVPVQEIVTIVLANPGSPDYVVPVSDENPPHLNAHGGISSGSYIPHKRIKSNPARIDLVYKGGTIHITVPHWHAKELFEHFKKEWIDNYV